MSNVHYLPFPPAIRCIDPVSPVRARAEQLMRRLVKSRCAYEHELRLLADLLDHIIVRVEEP